MPNRLHKHKVFQQSLFILACAHSTHVYSFTQGKPNAVNKPSLTVPKGIYPHKKTKSSSLNTPLIHTKNTIELAPMTVVAPSNNGSLTVPSLERSEYAVEQVPGGTNLIDGQRVREGAVFTVNDAFAYAPGIYVGDSQAGVASGSRISIRGSDINSNFSPISGIKFLRNGLPFTNANGYTDTESLNLSAMQHIEVYRGANAMEFGASNLGGAINLLTPTAYTAAPLKVGMSLGSNGYVNPSISGGKKWHDKWDAYGSLAYVDFDGNLDNTDQRLFYGYGNIGYRWNDAHETRLHVDIQQHQFHRTLGLTKEQLAENPQQSLGNPNDPLSGFPVYRVDLQHSVKLQSDAELNLGAYYFSKDNKYYFQDHGFYYDMWEETGLSWRHQFNGSLFGLKNHFTWGGLGQFMWIDNREDQPLAGQAAVMRFSEQSRWQNVEAYFQDQLSLSESFKLVLGAQINYRRAEFDHLFPELARTATQDFFNVSPKLGFLWQFNPQAQIYGNISRSAEPSALNTLNDVLQIPRLTSQTGTTIELGSRGTAKGFKWDLAFYHAWIMDELLTIPVPPNFTRFNISNAQDTFHTGIELGLETNLPLHWLSPDDQLRVRGSYTWSHFAFDADSRLGDIRLPGIPEHNGRVEVLYQHPNGVYIGPNITTVSSNWADFANSLAANPYTLVGARLGWDDGKHWKLYLDGRNLSNEHYAASVYVNGDARIIDPFGRGAVLFNPGPTAMVFGGIEYRY